MIVFLRLGIARLGVKVVSSVLDSYPAMYWDPKNYGVMVNGFKKAQVKFRSLVSFPGAYAAFSYEN